MAAAYGVAVQDAALTPRRMWVLLNHMPPAFRRPGEHWSVEAELLALLADHVANLTWVTLRANGAKSAQRPKPLPRPPRRAGAAAAAVAEHAAERQGSRWAALAEALTGMDGVVVHES